jgi:iron(III) transport system ATP-binding protein
MSLGDEIFLFNKGKVVQRGAPEELYFRPTVRYVAEFLGKANLFPVVVNRAHDGVTIAALPSRDVVTQGAMAGNPPDGEALCMVRPEAWRVGPAGASGVPARVQDTMFVGDRRELRVDTPFGVQTIVTPGYVRLVEGDALTLSVSPDHLHLIREDP